jgi:hypothetical protein
MTRHTKAYRLADGYHERVRQYAEANDWNIGRALEKIIDKAIPQAKQPEAPQPDLLQVWPTFDDFWDAYDKKIDRPKSERMWRKLKQKDKEEIMGYIPHYLKAQPDKQYRKNPTTFLNNESWKNEIVSNGAKSYEATILSAAAKMGR